MVDLKEIYFSTEDKWYAFVDNISDKLPFVEKIIDGVEAKNIPSFPLAILIILILIIALFFMFSGTGQALTIIVKNDAGDLINGASVRVYLNSDMIDEAETNSKGKVNFYLANEKYTIRIVKDGYVSVDRENVSPGEYEEEFILLLEEGTLTRSITLKNSTGELITGNGTIIYSCVDNGNQIIGNYTNGIFTADFSNCSEIKIDSISGYEIREGRITFSGTNNVLIDEIQTNTGTITVTLNGEKDLSGIRITINGEDGTPIDTKTTSESGLIVFENAPTKKYFVSTHDTKGNFKDYQGNVTGELKELKKDETINFNINLETAINSKITVNTKDFATDLPISGVEISLKDKTTQETINTEMTGITGQVEFNIAENSEYLISAEHPDYLILEGQNAESNDTINFNMVKATETNSQKLIVKILDPNNNPIDNVKVTLKKLDDTKIGEKTTGANGEVEFYNLELTNYYAYVVKEGFKGDTTNAIQIMPRRENILTQILEIGNGEIKLNILDETLNQVNAEIKAINYYTKEIENETQSSTGVFSIRADKKIYFLISSQGYPDYYTSAIYPDQDSTIEKNIILKRSKDNVNVKILGIYNQEGEIGSERIIGTGNYTVKAILEIPKGNFSEAGFHLRTGKATNNEVNLIEEDLAKLASVYSNANTITKGTTYSPPNNYSIDTANLTTGLSKWIEAKWKNPKEGIYEIETELIIEEANANTGINLWYRGYAKGGSTLRDPQNSNTGQELYASAKNYLLTSGATNLCKDNFCISKEIITNTGSTAGRKQYINNRFSANKGNSYTLKTGLTSRKTINNAILEIEGKGIEIQEILLNGVEKEETTTLGTISQDEYNEIEITFEIISSGTDQLKIKINSSTETELDEEINIQVKANKKFEMDLIPKQIIPYVNNTMFFTITDGNTPVKDALIEIKSNDTLLDVIETNSEGMAQYDLSSPSLGDNIKIKANKEGYDEIKIEKEVNEKLLIITPPEINETIKIGLTNKIETQLLIENASAEKLKIKSIRLNGELESYLNISINDLEGKTIDVEKDTNYLLTIQPNATAKKLREPKTIEGELEIITEIEETSQSYSSEIPINIRLSMPGYLDTDKCLKINPKNIEFNTGNDLVSKTIEIENSCTAEGIKVNLYDLEAKLNEMSKFGTISITGNGFNNASIGESYNEIASSFENDGKETITIRFNPNASLSNGEQDLVLKIRAKNITDESEETIETSINLTTSMNNLSKCIEIEEPEGGLKLDVAGWNLGYNRIMNSNMDSYAKQYQGFSNRYGARQSMPYSMNQQLPFMGQGNTQVEQDNFTIKNNCGVDVEIDLDPNSKINVGQEEFSISSGSDTTIDVSPGYVLGKFNIKVRGKISNSEQTLISLGSVDVTVRRLGDIDTDCIRTSVSKISLNSFLYTPEKYKVYNYCYNTGVLLTRNNGVSIQCNANHLTQTNNVNLGYLQVGQESLYKNQLPINNTYQNYNQYLQPNTNCSGNCALITGVNTFTHRIVNDTTEELTFEVMPSTQYMPQKRLFDSKTNSYGLFSNLVNFRTWLTETDMRTNVYGNLNVSYSNQYGSTQCMRFPIQIEDDWRGLESIDSAINWGDPTANPQDCVGTNEKKAFDLITYYKGKGKSQGEIPESEFNGNTYLRVAEPPAVKIGPAPTNTNYYPHLRNKENNENSRNCGLLDSISNLKYPKEIEGVKIKVESIKKGGLLNNTLGPNLVLELDRSGLDRPCVYINTEITGTLKRAISFESGTVSWPLKAIVTKKDFNPPANWNPEEYCYVAGESELDCEMLARQFLEKENGYKEFIEKYPQCEKEITKEQIEEMKNTQNTKGKCTEKAEEYGFDKIDLVDADEMTTTQAKKYCLNNFCNNEMLQLFVLDKYKNIKENLKKLSNKDDDLAKTKLSEIYKLAKTIDKNTCDETKKYYAGTNKIPIIIEFNLKNINEDLKETVNTDNLQNDDDKTPIIAMSTILANYDNEDLFIMYNNNGTEFLALDIYKKALENAKTDNVKNNTQKIDISCNNKSDLNKEELETIAKGNPKIVKLIPTNKLNLTEEEKYAIYNKNNDLGKINELAQYTNIFNSKLYLTAEEKITPLDEKLFTIFNDYTKTKNKITGLNGPGKYNVVLDGNLLELKINKKPDLNIILTEKEDVNKANKNIILIKGFDIPIIKTSQKATDNIIIDETGFYQRTPVLLIATLHAAEESFSYFNKKTTSENLIEWNYNGRIINDFKNGKEFTVKLGTSTTAKTLKGIYYYPENGELTIKTPGKEGLSVSARGLVFNTDKTDQATTKNTKEDIIEMDITQPKLKDIIKIINENKYACISNDNIIWNHPELME